MNAKEFIKSKGSTLTHNQMQGIAVIMEQYADHKTQQLQKEVERLKEVVKEQIKQTTTFRKLFNKERVQKHRCKEEIQQLKQENKELIDKLTEVENAFNELYNSTYN